LLDGDMTQFEKDRWRAKT